MLVGDGNPYALRYALRADTGIERNCARPPAVTTGQTGVMDLSAMHSSISCTRGALLVKLGMQYAHTGTESYPGSPSVRATSAW